MEFIFVVAFFVALIAMKKFNIIPFGMNVQTQDPPALPIDTSEIAKLIGGEYEFIPARIEPKNTLADNSKARELLGWIPQEDFEKGVEQLKN